MVALFLVGLLPIGLIAEDKDTQKDKDTKDARRDKDTKDARTDKDTIDDATFVKKAASGNMAEISAARIGSKEATSSEVRRFAQQLQKDHETAQSELKQAAKSARLDMPGEMLAEHKKGAEMLTKHKSEKGFDSAFLKHMVESHTKSVELYQQAGKSVKDENLRKYIDKTLPVVQDHLKMAKKLADNSKDN